jgi:L-threonylcarbamoyladenylate synthase
MTPLYIRDIDPLHPDRSLIILTAEILKKGGLVVAPTETKYGLIAQTDDVCAMERLFDLKKRDKTVPTAIFVHSRREIGIIGEENDCSRKLADSFLPGPLTLVLKARSAERPPVVVEGKVGIRYSSSPVIKNILEQIDGNLSATSANLSGTAEPQTVPEIAALFGGEVAIYLDAGPLRSPVSTVVDCSSGKEYRILRIGAISAKEISKSLERN